MIATQNPPSYLRHLQHVMWLMEMRGSAAFGVQEFEGVAPPLLLSLIAAWKPMQQLAYYHTSTQRVRAINPCTIPVQANAAISRSFPDLNLKWNLQDYRV